MGTQRDDTFPEVYHKFFSAPGIKTSSNVWESYGKIMVNVLCTDILIELMRKLWDACGTYCQPYENLYTGD